MKKSKSRRVRGNFYKNSQGKKKAQVMRKCFLCLKMVLVLAALGGMSFLFILAHDALVQSPHFKATKIVVEGNARLTQEAVLKQGGVALGDNVLDVNLKVLRHKLLAHPWIAAADVQRDLPDGMLIRIREQVPLAIVELNRPFLLNESGEIFKSLEPSDSVSVPVITGLKPFDVDPTRPGRSAALQAVMDLLRLTRVHGTVLPARSVHRVDVDHEMGLTIHGSQSGMTVKLGFGDYESKFNRLRDMIGHLGREAELLNVGLMDLNDLDRVVVRPARSETFQEVCYRKEM